LAQRIDALLARQQAAVQVTPAPLASDAEFLRRVTLDLAGRIPYAHETQAFLTDARTDKRARVIEQLLAGSGYAAHFTQFWRGVLLPEASASIEGRVLAPGFEAWLQQKLTADTSWDRVVQELLTLPISAERGQLQRGNLGQVSPSAFYAAKEAKPENLAASTARALLGVQLECAQCHNHPFAAWTREQFWSLAAFFAGIERTGPTAFQPLREIVERRELAIPGTERVVQATFLDDQEPQWKHRTSARIALADWVTAPANPYFAKATVNRLWGALFGVGIVDPVDDFNDNNAPSHPAVLDELARAFVASGFDLKYVLRTLALTSAYQRSSAQNPPSDLRWFARHPVRSLTGAQLFDSLSVATGYVPSPAEARNPFDSTRIRFLTNFAASQRPTEAQTSILQALTLMNGQFVAGATGTPSLEQGRTLQALLAFEQPTADRIDTLYLTALSRLPTESERGRVQAYLGAKPKPRQWGDVFWALLNSAEFRLNH
jgi:hypothetical protein